MTDILHWVKVLASCYVDANPELRIRQLLKERTVCGAIVESAQAVAQFLKLQFPESAVQAAAAKWTSAEKLIDEAGHLSPPEWQERLDEALAGAAEGVERLREPDLRLAGCGAFLVGATVHLHLLDEAAQRTPSRLNVLRATVGNYSGHVQALAEEMREQISQRHTLQVFDGFDQAETWKGSRWRPQRIAGKLKRLVAHSMGKAEAPTAESELYEYRIEGQLVGIFDHLEASVRLKHDISRHVDPMIALLLQTVDAWQEGCLVESIRQTYNRILERPVDSSSMNAWLVSLRSGANELHLIRDLAVSEEYQTRFVNPHPPEEAVRILFHHLLAQPPQPNQLNQYKALFLDRGLEALVDEILGSDEFQMHLGEKPMAAADKNGDVQELSEKSSLVGLSGLTSA
jgi:hypothetical protein